MKLYFETRTAWAGALVRDLICLCGEYYEENEVLYRNFEQALVMSAEAILTKNSFRNYRYTIETYFHLLCRFPVLPDDKFWNWGQYLVKGRIPFGNTGYFTIQFGAEEIQKKRCLTLDVECYGTWNVERPRNKIVSKIKTWKQDVLVAWLARYNWEILRLPLADTDRVMCVGEHLACQLYHNCDDIAGQMATYDNVEDRGQKWLLS